MPDLSRLLPLGARLTNILVAIVLLHPAVRSAERFLTTHALDPSASTA